MTDANPIACSLGASDLRKRLDEIAAVGADGLIAHEVDAGRHRLHFRADDEMRRRLEAIVAAEATCCPFLDLGLAERGGALVLEIGAPPDGQLTADALAAAFAGAADPA